MLSERVLKIHAEEGEAELREDLPTAPAGVDIGLTRSSSLRKRRRLSPHIPPTLVTKSIDYLPNDEAMTTNCSRVRQSITPELFDYVNMEPDSLDSEETSPRLTMDDYYDWKYIQNLFRPPPGATVSTTVVEGYEVEECEVTLNILIDILVYLTYFVHGVGNTHQLRYCLTSVFEEVLILLTA